LVRSDETTEHVYRAELLRIHGEALLRQDGDHASGAEQRFLEATALARGQGARVFELRAATSLARLWSGRGMRAAARARLEETLGQDDRRAKSADERAAQSLLVSLS
jgi:hypothetical protein